MKKQSLIRKFERWRASRIDLLWQIDALRKENDQLKERVVSLQQSKNQAEKHAEDRRNEKESLRARLLGQKKASESNELLLEQFGAKITELHAEVDRHKRSRKK